MPCVPEQEHFGPGCCFGFWHNWGQLCRLRPEALTALGAGRRRQAYFCDLECSLSWTSAPSGAFG